MMHMDVRELKALFGEKRVDYLLTRSRIPLARVDDDLVVMDSLYRLEEELTKDNEDLMWKGGMMSQDLHDAIEMGWIAWVRQIVEGGADVNATDRRGVTPLQTAIEHGELDIVRLLIEKGADVNERDVRGWTHLALASALGRPDIIELLLAHGADVNERDDIDDTALHWACTYARPGAVRLLLSHGGDANTRNMTGSTPLDMVLELSPENPAREEILDLFREYAPEAVMERFCEGPGR